MYSGKGETQDTPSPHSLRYFTGDPFERDDADDLCVKCSSPAEKAREARESAKYTITSEVRRAGTLDSFTIWTVLYRIREKDTPELFQGQPQGHIGWKSILVQTAPDQYMEIYHLQVFAPALDLTEAKIVRSGDESVLETEDPDGGNGGGCWEAYWWFDAAGSHAIDFSVLRPTIASHLPAGAVFQITCSTLHLEEQEIRSWVQEAKAECHACGYLGTVTARFRLHGARVEAADVRFQAGHP